LKRAPGISRYFARRGADQRLALSLQGIAEYGILDETWALRRNTIAATTTCK